MMTTPAIQRNNDHSFTITGTDVCFEQIDAVLQMLWKDAAFDPIVLILSQSDTDALLLELEALHHLGSVPYSDIKPRFSEYQNPTTKTVIRMAISRTFSQGTFKLVGKSLKS